MKGIVICSVLLATLACSQAALYRKYTHMYPYNIYKFCANCLEGVIWGRTARTNQIGYYVIVLVSIFFSDVLFSVFWSCRIKKIRWCLESETKPSGFASFDWKIMIRHIHDRLVNPQVFDIIRLLWNVEGGPRQVNTCNTSLGSKTTDPLG